MGKQPDISSSWGGEPSEYTVEEFYNRMKEDIKPPSGIIKIRGEISKIQKSSYFAIFNLLGNNKTSITCKISSMYLNIDINEGMMIDVTGMPEVNESFSNISFLIKKLELIGEGTIKNKLDMLKENFRRNGYFDIKKPIPKFAKNIGLITSDSGRVKSDFQKYLVNRGIKIFIRDTKMAGQDAIVDVANAIKEFNESKIFIDILILTRGGGSWESLEPFNSEEVCYAILESKIPIICGIGHETDESGAIRETLADLVSDYRESTASGIAKMLNQDWDSAKVDLNRLDQDFFENSNNWNKFIYKELKRLETESSQNFDRWKNVYDREEERFKRYEKDFWINSNDWIFACKNKIDQIDSDFGNNLKILKNKFDLLEKRFSKNSNDWIISISKNLKRLETESSQNFDRWKNVYDREEERFKRYEKDFWINVDNWSSHIEEILKHFEQVFESSNPKNRLRQGGISFDNNGHVIKDVSKLKEQEKINIMFENGNINCTINYIHYNE